MGQCKDAILVSRNTEGIIVPPKLTLDCKSRLELAHSSLNEMTVPGVQYQSLGSRAGRNRTGGRHAAHLGSPGACVLKVASYFAETAASL